MKAITIAINTDGSARMLAGPEVPPAKQRRAVQELRVKGLPKGVERVEIWQRNCVKVAVAKAQTVAKVESMETTK